MVAQNLNTNCYALGGSASSVNLTLKPDDAYQTTGILYNTDTTYTCFVLSGTGTAPTAVIPASGSFSPCKPIPPGGYLTFTKKDSHEIISAIWSGAATGSLYASFGAGE